MDDPTADPDVLADIARLYQARGSQPYNAGRRESVTALEHALQCAQLAEWAEADLPLVAAALLHDIGDFIDDGADTDALDNRHELRGHAALAAAFGRDVTEPVRLHVAAKRYLVATDPSYAQTLSDASRLSLALQGGPMSDEEASRFEDEPFAPQAVMLRRWDDAAKTPGKQTPSLDYYVALLQEVRDRSAPVRRTVVGAFDA